MCSLWEQAEEARDKAEKEKQRRSMEEYYRRKEENGKLRRELEDNLNLQDIINQEWSTIIREARNSRRHNVFYQGSSKARLGLYQNNLTHIVSPDQVRMIIEQLKRWGSFKDQEYVERVALAEAIVAIYADYHKMPHEEANDRVSATLVNDNEGIVAENEAAQLVWEEEQKKQEDKAERKAKKVKAREKKQQFAEEKENKARPRFTFSENDKKANVEGTKKEKETKLSKEKAEKARLEAEKKKKTEVEEEKKEKEGDKKGKDEEKQKMAEKISSRVKERWAEKKKHQPRRAEALERQKPRLHQPEGPEIPVGEREEAASVEENSETMQAR